MAKEKLLPVVQETAKVDISKMSMLERTAHFEKLRKEKLEKKESKRLKLKKQKLRREKSTFIKSSRAIVVGAMSEAV